MDEFDKLLETISFDPIGITNQLLSLASIVHILIAAVFGFLILFIYLRTGRHYTVARSFIPAIPVLTILMAVLMRMDGGKAIVFFGIFGILSIVRFRAVLPEPKDIAYVLFAIITGILIGIGNFVLVILAFIVITLSILIIQRLFYSLKSTQRYQKFLFISSMTLTALKSVIELHLNSMHIRFQLTSAESEYSFSNKKQVWEDVSKLSYMITYNSLEDLLSLHEKTRAFCQEKSIEVSLADINTGYDIQNDAG